MTQNERQERSKEEIYQAALEEFGTYGYDNVNMERICGNHGISKGMMYHYYSSKDELFLLCVKRTFQDLTECVERDMGALECQDISDKIKNFFLIREYFFQLHPKQKLVFESAMLRPPKHLTEQIQALRAPIRHLNHEFIKSLVDKMPLRPDLDPDAIIRYLGSIEPFFPNIVANYQDGQTAKDFHAILESVGEVLNIVLFGMLRQTEQKEFSKFNPASELK